MLSSLPVNQNRHKIPDSAECVFKGVLHDIYQWDQPIRDGQTIRYEAIRHHPSVAVIAVTDDVQILLIKEDQAYNGSYVTIPGGVAQSGDYEDEARRELREETGYSAGTMRLYTVIDEVVPYSKLEWKSYIFLAHGCKKVSPLALDPGESITVVPSSPEDFIAAVCSEGFGITWLRDRFRSIPRDEAVLMLKNIDAKH